MISATRWAPRTGFKDGLLPRTTEYSGMKARTVCPMAPKLRTNAPATSAKPPVFAYGTISELKIHSFNGDMKRSLTNAAQAPRETWCRRRLSVSGFA